MYCFYTLTVSLEQLKACSLGSLLLTGKNKTSSNSENKAHEKKKLRTVRYHRGVVESFPRCYK